MRKIDRATIHFQHVHMFTGVNIGNPWTVMRTIYVDGILQVVRYLGQIHEAWHCPTDKIWKCHIPVEHISAGVHVPLPTTWHGQPQNQMGV